MQLIKGRAAKSNSDLFAIKFPSGAPSAGRSVERRGELGGPRKAREGIQLEGRSAAPPTMGAGSAGRPVNVAAGSGMSSGHLHASCRRARSGAPLAKMANGAESGERIRVSCLGHVGHAPLGGAAGRAHLCARPGRSRSGQRGRHANSSHLITADVAALPTSGPVLSLAAPSRGGAVDVVVAASAATQ